ncbi:hypothetical protein WH47_09473 [Habropoda laboriosa]|uniref:Odorant receptor n=1 Tax=Habropoda laboriosa TaxID=597456 RepID=A0A0L7QJG8_9HYME|nr:PREDICTED: uncharacterized protein LOC108570037 [Habropoda laboriosa]KOC58719.1 hypothetical protein WH47_09473 [Habropoda laboriosa]
MSNDKTVVTEINITASSDYSLQWNRWAMKSIGAWPQSSSNLERIISRILNVICYTAVLFTIIPCSLHVMLEKETFYTKVKILGPLSHWVFCIISYTMLLLRRKTIRHFFNHMETDWRTTMRKEKKEIMLKYAKFSRYAAISCTIFIHGGILGYCVMTAFTTMVVVVGNETMILRVLPLPMYKGLLPVDTNTMNEIVLLSQFLSGFIANTSAISVISLTSALTSHASGQLGVVMLSIEDFVSDARRRGKDDHFDEIPTIVEKHLRVLNFISRIEAMINKACFLELTRCTIAICVLGYYIFMVDVILIVRA